MTKPVLGIVVGGILGIFDGLTAPLSAPETLPQLPGIVAGSTVKGIIAGILIGLFARKVKSAPGVLLFGLAVGASLAALITIGGPYFWEIVIPGAIVGLLVGFATFRFGTAPKPVAG